MLPLGIVLGFAGYGLATWGWVLVKGYNITLGEWFSPLHPYTGKLDANGCVPQGSLFPVKGKGGPCSSSSSGGHIQANPPGVPSTAPNPHGQVQ